MEIVLLTAHHVQDQDIYFQDLVEQVVHLEDLKTLLTTDVMYATAPAKPAQEQLQIV